MRTMTLKERIAHLLKTTGKKNKDLAVFVGVEASAVSQWKKVAGRGKATAPGADKIPKIAEFFGVTKEWLMFGDEAMPQEIESAASGQPAAEPSDVDKILLEEAITEVNALVAGLPASVVDPLKPKMITNSYERLSRRRKR